jgi:hypothetical protein
MKQLNMALHCLATTSPCHCTASLTPSTHGETALPLLPIFLTPRMLPWPPNLASPHRMPKVAPWPLQSTTHLMGTYMASPSHTGLGMPQLHARAPWPRQVTIPAQLSLEPYLGPNSKLRITKILGPSHSSREPLVQRNTAATWA